jgi:hypothetical protein
MRPASRGSSRDVAICDPNRHIEDRIGHRRASAIEPKTVDT